ncbi:MULTISPECIES: response regulator transcription factor [Helicobacter]|uniref:Phosphate regulon transcriptional regulatory protein PhoB n=2 Tax=Helicobacter TaxID=209 RepID=A0A377J509_9HELI|nr:MULTISPECIES: response regulator transcription factor [Helicobacter]MDL0080338.1 response regulator transcription factor [Helicobacter sp. CPD2-1]MDL0082514.1 response regulator transcription factor [Helicobacter sp. XJK30-2]STO97572.1 phosphate regulon response regulator [Helicobacter canis]
MVYVLEDDSSILELVLYALSSQNIEAKGFDNALDFNASLTKELPALIVLDLMLPNENGLSILKRLREKSKTRDIPVIILSALGSEYDKIKGLDLGADDYLSKPFSALELLARIRALLRRYNGDDFGDLVLDTLSLSPKRHTITLDNQEIKTTLKEFDLLACLLKNPDRTFSREELLELVWGYELSGETRTVDMHINTLRNKLGSFGKKIETIRGVGYKLNTQQA